jgi:riboflavin biosynthesis pyrimidine reductase
VLLTLFDEARERPLHLTDPLRERYGGDLCLPRNWVFANFVASLDGVVSVETAGESGHIISGDNASDRFVMGLLRAAADAVVIGAGTFRKTPRATWQPDEICPEHATDFAALRATLGLRPRPELLVLSASGSVGETSDLHVLRGQMSATEALAKIRTRGHQTILVEGGPSLLAQLINDRLLDEIFLTRSPMLFGRHTGDSRKSLVDGIVDTQPLRLVSLRRDASHLFTRYAVV